MAKNINFQKKGAEYEAEIKLNDVGAIHIETAYKGQILIGVSHVEEGHYSPIPLNDTKTLNKTTVDFTLDDDVYPVYVRLISTSPVEKAYGSDSITDLSIICDDSTNPELMAVARAKGWVAPDATTMTKGDAAKVTALVTHWWYQFGDLVIDETTEGVTLEAHVWNDDTEEEDIVPVVFDDGDFVDANGKAYDSAIVHIIYEGEDYYCEDSDGGWDWQEENQQGYEALKSFDELVYFTGLTKIGYTAFQGCSSLTSVNIPAAVKAIDFSAFRHCTALISVELPNVQTIGNGAFQGCTSLASVDMPAVQIIEVNAFEGCASLTSIHMPNVRELCADAFCGCASLTSVEMPNVLHIECSFEYCTALTSVIMPNVQNIDTTSFNGCTALTSVIMPNVQNIGGYAFNGCTSLSSVTIDNVTPPTLGSSAFKNNAIGRKIYVPAEAVNAYKTATNWSTYANDILPIE